MGQELKIGALVHITTQRQVHGYRAGCRRMVVSEPSTDKSGKTYYGVRMDKDGATLFLADGIEAEGGNHG